jgi:hypothetical protein
MNPLHQILAAIVGVCAAVFVLDLHSSSAPGKAAMLSECDGTLRQIVIHYVAGDTAAMPIYQQFLPQLTEDVTAYVVCADQKGFDEFAQRIGRLRCAVAPIIVEHPITAWSRDRWIALQDERKISLLAPRDEDAADLWPARSGDARVALDIARQLKPGVVAQKLDLFFDGGDSLANSKNIFVSPEILTKNLGRTYETREELLASLATKLGRPIVLLDSAPNHHVGMYMMAADDRTMLVGDPSLAEPFGKMFDLPGGADFSSKTQRLFDAVATQVAGMGYRVVRIPTVVANDGRTFLTYVNVITDHRAGTKIVYLPIYRQADALNASAAQVWRCLGYEVRPIDCTSCYRYFGTLHCLVNVLQRN